MAAQATGAAGTFGSELSYLIKRVHFFRREVPIIVQNKNGPCPLLAIANILLLRNQLQLHQDAGEISDSRLMSLVAERLLDTNLNVSGKDAAYVSNQQQNISDAIALLPKLATGIDVNVRFKSIVDFEFTSECAIFDLLDISLVHGWLVDPQVSASLRLLLKSFIFGVLILHAWIFEKDLHWKLTLGLWVCNPIGCLTSHFYIWDFDCPD